MRSEMNQRLRQYLSAELRQWLSSNKDGGRFLTVAGIPARSLISVRTGRCTEKLLLMYRPAIEKVTGLSVDKICVKAVKRDLWGENDKLPEIVSRVDVVRELRRVAEGRLGEIQRQLKSGHGRKQFEEFVADPDKLWVTRLRSALTVIAQFPVVHAPSAVETGNAERSKRIVDSLISMSNSLVSISTTVNSQEVPDGAKFNIAYAAARLFNNLGIDGKVLQALRQKQLLTGNDLASIESIVTLFGSTKRRP